MRIKYGHLEVIPVLSERDYLGEVILGPVRFLSIRDIGGLDGDDDDDGDSDKNHKS